MLTVEADGERQFLEQLYGRLSGGEVVALAYSVDGPSGLRHEVFPNVDVMRARAGELANQSDVRAIYHSIAVYREAPRGEKFRREAANVARLNVIAIDLDCGAGKEYADKKTAVADVKAIMPNVLGFGPERCLAVDSGNGIHLYLMLSRSLPLDEWKPLAEMVKRELRAAGLRLDQTVTADAARIMRTPGTWNRKDPANPKLCRVLRRTDSRVDPCELADRLAACGATASLSGKASKINDEALMEFRRRDPETVENVERVRSALAAIPPNCGYDGWRNVVFALLWTGWQCAAKLAREWSMTAPEKWDEEAFDKLVASYRDKPEGIMVGTLFHLASEYGWQKPRGEPTAADTPAQVPERIEPRYRLMTADEVAALPPVRWRVRGVLPAEGLAAIYGPPGSGKSFLALHLLGAVADGRSWFTHRTEPAPVTYVALEGEAGIAQRVQAYRSRYGKAPAGMHFVTQAMALLEPGDVADLAEAIRAAGGAGGIVAIDTLNRAAPGADENDSRDMGAIIKGAKLLQAALGGLVLLVHHSGKDVSKGLRGHSSLLAAMDAVIEVSRSGEAREWNVTKSKDGRDGVGGAFRLDIVELGEDEGGFSQSSCVVAPTERPLETLKEPTGKNQRLVLDRARALIRAANTERPKSVPAGVPDGVPVIRFEDLRDDVVGRLECSQRHKRGRAAEAINELRAIGWLGQADGYIWLCPTFPSPNRNPIPGSL